MPVAPSLTMNDGRTIPQIGFGVWQVPDDVVAAATLTAFEAGYRHIDTAAAYENERGVGEAIAQSGLPRDEIFLTTKVWNTEHGFDQTLRAFDSSLGLLGVAEVDLYLVHWPSPKTGDYLQTWRALVQLHAEGRARSIGVCNFHEAHLAHVIAETGYVPVVNQIELHPWLPQTALRAFNADLGILVEAWSPLASGELINDSVIAGIADEHGKSPAQIMIRWHVQLGNVVLPKSVTPTRIRENIDVFDFVLTAENLTAIGALESGHRTGPNPDEFM